MRKSLEVSVADRRRIGDEQADDRAAAFTRLAERHLDASYRLARAILRDPGEAQDATHDAYVQAWRKWSTLRDPDRFGAWFDRILVNTCRNRLQRSTRWQARDISSEVVAAHGDPFGQTLDRDVIGVALRTLSPDHQIVVALRYYLDLPVDGIAARLGIPPGTVQSRLHYAIERLQGAIDSADRPGGSR
ncbi:MAG TPA: sigma-70 family RNA polymerase sigma factor [Patescibacteria group bacterium]|nr:sigma-70 family RNA polymerase sigma factor [Patescibacteria group bacterium]